MTQTIDSPSAPVVEPSVSGNGRATILGEDLIPSDVTRAFVTPRPSREERRARGKAARAALPRDVHGLLRSDSGDRDPVALLQAQDEQREPALVPLRYGRMSASPFAFFRGAAAVMAADLGRLPHTGLRVQLCGDAHLANFGMFASPDRRLVFDLNDFDETLQGPFEWDVKRLAASLAVAGRQLGLTERGCRRAARAATESYRTTMRVLAQAPTLDVWYARVDVDALTARVRAGALSRPVTRAAKASARNTGDAAVGKLTETVDGRRRFRDRPPLLVPVREDDNPGLVARTAKLYRRYLATLPPDRALLLLRYSFVDLAHKVVGVGSVGTRALVLLLESGDGEPLVLQIKQAGPSVLEPFAGSSAVTPRGRRVVLGQRLLQATGDPFLGWASGGEDAPFDFYVRQLRDMKGAVDLERLDGAALRDYGKLCGAVLARAHARAGDPSLLAGYLGSGCDFDRAVADFAVAYAALNELDHARLVRAVQSGAVRADTA